MLDINDCNTPALRAAWNRVSSIHRDIVNRNHDIIPAKLTNLIKLLNAVPGVLFHQMTVDNPEPRAIGLTTVRFKVDGIFTERFNLSAAQTVVADINSGINSSMTILLKDGVKLTTPTNNTVSISVQYSFIFDDDESDILNLMETSIQNGITRFKPAEQPVKQATLDLLNNRPFGIESKLKVRTRGDRVYITYNNPVLRFMKWLGVVGV